MLTSLGHQVLGESEAECANRVRFAYGLERAIMVCVIMGKFAPSRGIQAYWRNVEQILGELISPAENVTFLVEERELIERVSRRRAKRTFAQRSNTERN